MQLFSVSLISAKCYKAQERVRVVQPEQQQTSMIECFRLLFQNKMLMLLTLASIFGSLAFGNNLITYFFKYMLPDGQFGGFVGALGITTIYSALTYAPSFIGMIFATKLKDLCGGYRNLIIVIQVCTIIGRVAAFLIGFEGKNMLIGIVIMAILNIPSGAGSIAQTSLFCDSVDFMEWKTGKRTEGVTFAMQTFFTKVSSGITGGLATLSLGLIGYQAVADVPGAVYYGTQSATFESWIWPLVMLTPAIAALLYIIPILFIRYSPEQKAQVEKELAERRAVKQTSEKE